MDRVKQLESGIEYLIDMIDVATEDIEKDCAEKGGFMAPMASGKLSVYYDVRRILTSILEGENE